MMTKVEAAEAVVLAKSDKKLTWEQIAAEVGMSPVWTTSACLGQNSMPKEVADKLCKFLNLGPEVSAALQAFPYKGSETVVPTDPLIYRLYEIVQVYGPTLKELIHEKFGDGIMSAIDFTMHVEKVPDPKGDRVKLTMNGKFLPYKMW
nr:cyanase [Candidatus Manganitrophus noduliformans]